MKHHLRTAVACLLMSLLSAPQLLAEDAPTSMEVSQSTQPEGSSEVFRELRRQSAILHPAALAQKFLRKGEVSISLPDRIPWYHRVHEVSLSKGLFCATPESRDKFVQLRQRLQQQLQAPLRTNDARQQVEQTLTEIQQSAGQTTCFVEDNAAVEISYIDSASGNVTALLTESGTKFRSPNTRILFTHENFFNFDRPFDQTPSGWNGTRKNLPLAKDKFQLYQATLAGLADVEAVSPLGF